MSNPGEGYDARDRGPIRQFLFIGSINFEDNASVPQQTVASAAREAWHRYVSNAAARVNAACMRQMPRGLLLEFANFLRISREFGKSIEWLLTGEDQESSLSEK